jgi:hypothetical protein
MTGESVVKGERLTHFLEKNRFAIMLILYLAFSTSVVHVYVLQISNSLSTSGLKVWNMTVAGWAAMVIGLPYLAWNISRINGKPSDFFQLFYSVIAVTSYILLHSVWGRVPPLVSTAGALVLVTPLLALELFKRRGPTLLVKGVLDASHIEAFVALVMLVVVTLAYMHPPSSAGFGLSDIYIRRLEGRHTYPAGTLLAYGLSMSMNGFSPYLAFRAGLKMRLDLLVLAMVAVVFFYWLLGVKAPVLYIAVSFLLGFSVRRNVLKPMAYCCLSGVLILWCLVLVDKAWGGGNSAIANYFFMRVFAVQAEMQGMYLKFLFDPKLISWSWLFGSNDPGFAATYYIGEHYANSADNNANTNAFLYQLAAKGLAGYCAAVLFVPLFLGVLDRLFQACRNPSYLFLGFLYGLLVVEQAFTVAMLSSGVGVLFLLTLFEKAPDLPSVHGGHTF